MSPRKAAPIEDVEVLSDKKKIKLLMDPLRIAIISVLGREPMTVKQIAVELNRKPGTILHHLDRLKKAKLVVQVRTEKTRTGIVQRYYRATAREYQIGVAKVVSRKPTLEETKETPEDRWRGVIIGAAVGGVLGVALAAPTIASLRIIGRYLYAKLFDLDPFPMVGAPSLPRRAREREAERLAAAASRTPSPEPEQGS